ncbi:hypothetical protein BDZ89DRAFT_686453 [Hymenopellis radicata]|nr:hypothetical protein BDZ89DRAFT_686453 [Hymenopellis radicata]
MLPSPPHSLHQTTTIPASLPSPASQITKPSKRTSPDRLQIICAIMRVREYSVTRVTETIQGQTQRVLLDAPSPRTSYPLSGGMLAAVTQGDATSPDTYNTTPAQGTVQPPSATDTFVRDIQLPSPRPTPEWAATQNAPNGRARRVYRALPSQIENEEETVVHPLLQRVPDMNTNTSVDFSQPWEIIKAAWPSSSLHELATSPPLPSLAVVIHLLPWAIVIQPATDQAYVTVEDVIFRVWECLHFPLDASLAANRTGGAVDEEDVSEITNSWRAETDMEPKLIFTQAKRLVYLRGRTRFTGLNKKTSDGDTWAMRMA